MVNQAPGPSRRSAPRSRRGGTLQALRAREMPIRLGLAAFFWTTVLGPALHLIDHRADHVHGAGAARGHDHGPGARPHQHDATRASSSDTAPIRSVGTDSSKDNPTGPLPGHGHGESLHFGLALVESAQAVLLAPPQPIAEATPPEPTGVAPARESRAAHYPRGPPGSPLG